MMKETGDSWELKATTGDLKNWVPGGYYNKCRNMLSLNEIFLALQIAVFSVVFAKTLMEEHMLLTKYHDALMWIEQRARFISDPLGGCERCFAGQVALWSYLYLKWPGGALDWLTESFKLFLFIAITIFLTIQLKKLV